MSALSVGEIKTRLRDLKGWNFESNDIFREFDMGNFENAVSFLVRIAQEARKVDHHPDICIHHYKNLKVMLSTRSEGGVTEKDFMMASAINTLENQIPLASMDKDSLPNVQGPM